MKQKVFYPIFSFLVIFACSPSQNLETYKTQAELSSSQTLIYSLPKTRIDIAIEVTKTVIKKGPYAEYANKYLTLTDVPTVDSELFEISKVGIVPLNEPDPSQYYAISFKQYPANLDKLFAFTQQGLMLDLQNSWRSVYQKFPSLNSGSNNPFEKSIYEPNIEEHIDTLYKTILTDSSFMKVPIYKKSMQIKNEEDKAKDMAELILKLRKRRLKLMMGDYDYHPDGSALKVINYELAKQEEELLCFFKGKRIQNTQIIHYTLLPTGTTSKELTWFSSEKGISTSQQTGATPISITVISKDAPAQETPARQPEKATNGIYFRAPVMTNVQVKQGTSILAESVIPVYQFGKLQILPVLP